MPLSSLNEQTERTVRKKIKLCQDQDDFIFEDWKYGGFFGEYGNGKTTSAILRARRLSLNSNNVGMVLRKTWGDNRDTTLKQFHDLLPLWEQYYKSSEHQHKLPNGSIIYWRGMDRVGRVMQLNNYNLGWFWIEQMEELFEEVWNTLEGRLKLTDIPLSGFGTANPAGHNWCWKKFISPAKNKNYKYFQPPARWNAQNLPEKYYEEKEKNWPPQMVARFLNGKHEGYEGLLYSIFDRKQHVRNYSKDDIQEIQTKFRANGTFWEFQDYGLSTSNPMVWLWAWLGPDGILRIIDEYYQFDCRTIDNAVKMVKAKRALWRIEGLIAKTIACPRSFQHEKDGKSPADSFYDLYGMRLMPNPVQFEVRYPFTYQKFNEYKIEISESCLNLIAELESLTWENINTADDHAVEALERGLPFVFKEHGEINMDKVAEHMIERKTRTESITAGIMTEAF